MNRHVHVVIPLSMKAGKRRVAGVTNPRALMREALAKVREQIRKMREAQS